MSRPRQNIVTELKVSPAIARARAASRWRLGLVLAGGLLLLWIIGWTHG